MRSHGRGRGDRGRGDYRRNEHQDYRGNESPGAGGQRRKKGNRYEDYYGQDSQKYQGSYRGIDAPLAARQSLSMVRSRRRNEPLQGTKANRRPLRTPQGNHLSRRKQETVDFQRARNRDIVFIGGEDSHVLFSPFMYSKNWSDLYSANRYDCLEVFVPEGQVFVPETQTEKVFVPKGQVFVPGTRIEKVFIPKGGSSYPSP